MFFQSCAPLNKERTNAARWMSGVGIWSEVYSFIYVYAQLEQVKVRAIPHLIILLAGKFSVFRAMGNQGIG